MSAGREREDEIRPGVSLEGARAADWAAEKRMSLMALWWKIRSPLPHSPLDGHQRGWGILGKSKDCCVGGPQANNTAPELTIM